MQHQLLECMPGPLGCGSKPFLPLNGKGTGRWECDKQPYRLSVNKRPSKEYYKKRAKLIYVMPQYYIRCGQAEVIPQGEPYFQKGVISLQFNLEENWTVVLSEALTHAIHKRSR